MAIELDLSLKRLIHQNHLTLSSTYEDNTEKNLNGIIKIPVLQHLDWNKAREPTRVDGVVPTAAVLN